MFIYMCRVNPFVEVKPEEVEHDVAEWWRTLYKLTKVKYADMKISNKLVHRSTSTYICIYTYTCLYI